MISASSSSSSFASCGSRSSMVSPPLAQLGRSLERHEQRLEVVRIIVAHPVDEEGWRAVHAAANAAQEVLVDPVRVDVLRELLVEQVEVELDRLSVGTQVVDPQTLLVLVKMVMHLPEPVLGGRRLGLLGRVFGMGMRGADREVAEDEPQLLLHPFL